MKRIRHILEYALLRLLGGLIGLIPRAAALEIGATLGSLFFLLGLKRRVVLENLAIAFPERSASWRRRCARRTYRHFGRMIIETMNLPRLSPRHLKEILGFPDYEDPEFPLFPDRSSVFVGAHFGNWEIAQVVPHLTGRKVVFLYQPIHNPYIERYLMSMRKSWGQDYLVGRWGMRRALESLKEGRTIGMLADQDAGEHGVFVPFFSRSASTMTAPVRLAAATGSALIPVFVPMVDGLRYDFRVGREIPTGDTRAALEEFSMRIEEVVREFPEQYFWFHKRWKTRPPDGSLDG